MPVIGVYTGSIYNPKLIIEQFSEQICQNRHVQICEKTDDSVSFTVGRSNTYIVNVDNQTATLEYDYGSDKHNVNALVRMLKDVVERNS